MSQKSEKDIKKSLGKHLGIATDFVVSCSQVVYENNNSKMTRLDGSVSKEKLVFIKGKCTTFNNENIVYLLSEGLEIGVTLLYNQKTIYTSGHAKNYIPDSGPIAPQSYNGRTPRLTTQTSNHYGALSSMPLSIEKFIVRSVGIKVSIGATIVSFFTIFFMIIFVSSGLFVEGMFLALLIITIILFFGVNIGCMARYCLIKKHPEQHKNYQTINREYGINMINLELKEKLIFEGKYFAITDNYLIICANNIAVIPLKNARYVGMRTVSSGKNTQYSLVVIYKDRTFTNNPIFSRKEIPDIEQVLGRHLGIMTGDFKKHCRTYKMNSFTTGLRLSEDFISSCLAFHDKKRRQVLAKLTISLANIIPEADEVDE